MDAQEVHPGVLESKVLPTIAKGLSRSFDFSVLSSTLDMGNPPLGLILRSKNETSGVFVGNVKPGGAASKVMGAPIVRGMRLVIVDGEDVENASEDKVLDILKQASGQIIVKAVYDPQGYAKIDKGEELRRLSEYYFHHQWTGDAKPFEHQAKYCGAMAIENVSPASVKTAVKKLTKSISLDTKVMEVVVLNSALIGRPPPIERFQDGQVSHVIRIIDMVSASANGKALAVVSMDIFERRERKPRCHVFLFENKTHANQLAKILEECKSVGSENVKRAMYEDDVPPIIESMPAAPENSGTAPMSEGSNVFGVTLLRQLIAYYTKFAPNTKTESEFQAIVQKCINEQSFTWMDGILTEKYGTSFSEYLEVLKVETRNSVARLSAYYGKHDPGSKSQDELEPIGERWARGDPTFISWLDNSTKQKYGESFTEFIETAAQVASEDNEVFGFEDSSGPVDATQNEAAVDDKIQKYRRQLMEYYDKHAPGTKTEDDILTVAKRCAETGHKWMNEPMKSKYGESFDEFLAGGSTTAPVVAEREDTGRHESFGGFDEPAAVPNDDEILTDGSTSAVQDEILSAEGQNLFENLKAYYEKHAPNTKTDEQILFITKKAEAEGIKVIDQPLQSKYGESYSKFVANKETAQSHDDEDFGGFEAIDTTKSEISSTDPVAYNLQCLLDYYAKHAPGTKTIEELTPVSRKCVKSGIDWLNGPMKNKYGESYEEFLDGLPELANVYLHLLVKYYENVTPGVKTENELIPISKRCVTNGVAWMDPPLTQKYGISFIESVLDEAINETKKKRQNHGPSESVAVEPEPEPEGFEAEPEPEPKGFEAEPEPPTFQAPKAPPQVAELEPEPEGFEAEPDIICLELKGLGAQEGGGLHVKSRGEHYPNSEVARFAVPDDKVSWKESFEDYAPPHYTASVCADPVTVWSDKESDLPNIKFNTAFSKSYNRSSTIAEYSVDSVSFMPYNPCGRTGITGQGILGRFGPNHAADPIVSRWKRDESGNLVYDSNNNCILEWVAIERKDNASWAIPGGFVEPGEAVSETLKREFGEESLNMLSMDKTARKQCLAKLQDVWDRGTKIYQGYMDDERNTDNAWIETVCYNFHDSTFCTNNLPLEAGDDAANAKWIGYSIGNPMELELHAAHVTLLELAYNSALETSPPKQEKIHPLIRVRSEQEDTGRHESFGGFDEPAAAVPNDDEIQKYRRQLMEYYDKHAPGTKTEDDLLIAAKRCAEKGHKWMNEPMKSKYGESFDEFLTPVATVASLDTLDKATNALKESSAALENAISNSKSPKGSDKDTPTVLGSITLEQLKQPFEPNGIGQSHPSAPGKERMPRRRIVAERNFDQIRVQLTAYYMKHAPGTMTKEIKPLAERVLAEGSTWLNIITEKEHGESFDEFVYLDQMTKNVLAFYDKHAPGNSPEDLEDVLATCAARKDASWLDESLTGKYNQSFSDFVAELSEKQELIIKQILAFYEKHSPGSKTSADFIAVSERSARNGIEWMDEPMRKKYGQTLSSFISNEFKG